MKILLILLFFITPFIAYSQTEYEPSEINPYGLPNPDAPAQLSDFAPMIGICDCTEQRRIDVDEWAEKKNIVWDFKYTLNGMAIQDMIFRNDGNHSGNVRQYNSDRNKWYVKYYTVIFNPDFNSVLSGNKVGDKIVLTMDQKSKGGVDGKTVMTFYDISDSGFSWISEWLTTDESVIYPFLKIECKKRM